MAFDFDQEFGSTVQAINQYTKKNGDGTTGQRDYPLIWAKDAGPKLEQQSLIRGVIVPESMIITYGESNSGKTFHVAERDLCLSVGRNWYDRECEPGFVLYCAAEGPHSVERRVHAYCREFLADYHDIPFAILPHSLDLFRPAADTEPLIDFIKRLEDRRQMRCIKVSADTVSRVMAGGNENSPEDMGEFIRNADAIRHQISCAIEGIHHAGKDTAKGARGHSSLRAATDTEIEVSNKDGLHIARITKQRDFEVGEEFAFTLEVVELGQDKYGHPITTCVPRWKLDHQPGRGGSGLSKQQAACLKMIREVMDARRTLPPLAVLKEAKTPPKPGQIVCPVDVLRDYVVEVGGLSESDSPDTQRKALNRSINALRDAEIIKVFKGYIWLTGQRDMTGHF